MNTGRIKTLVILAMLILTCGLYAQANGFRIESVSYEITGSTREYPLRKAVPIDTKTVFQDQTALDTYITKIRLLFSNERVFDSSEVIALYGEADSFGIVPVFLTVRTEDTINIIALPYPKYNSNDGLSLKIKIKNYNFFGSMQELDTEFVYESDIDGDKSIEGGFSFIIPFVAYTYECIWDIASSLTWHFESDPEFDLNTGLDVAFPLSFADLHLGFVQSIHINDRDDDNEQYVDDLYFSERLYVKLPITLYETDSFGDVVWTPYISFLANWDSDGISSEDLKGPDVSFGQTISVGQIDWDRNFRNGVSAEAGVSWTHNFNSPQRKEVTIDSTIKAYKSFYDRLALYTRLRGFYNFDDFISEKQGVMLRGILDKRIQTDTAVYLNIDIPVRVMRVDFLEVTGVSWTRYISFEMHVSPFFDMAITHDLDTGSQYSFADGWYAGGLEVIVFPLKMRSIYARASVGFDLVEAWESGNLSGESKRDGESIREISIGLGFQY